MALRNLSACLYFLDVHSNKLQGELPPLPKSATFPDYSSNNFDLTIPNDIGNKLSTTMFFSLSKNKLHGLIPEPIFQAWYLKVLDLSNNNLTGPIATYISLLAQDLKALNLHNNNLNGRIPNSFPETCILKSLDLGGNRLEGQIPMSLSNCKELEVLDVGNNHNTHVFPSQLKKISSLHILVLRSNGFLGKVRCNGGCGALEKRQIVDLMNTFHGELPVNALPLGRQ